MEFYSGQPENPAASVRDYCTGVLIYGVFSFIIITLPSQGPTPKGRNAAFGADVSASDVEGVVFNHY